MNKPYRPRPPKTLNDLADVNLENTISNELLGFSGSFWVNRTQPDIEDINNLTIGEPKQDGDVVKWDGEKWVSGPVDVIGITIPNSLQALTDDVAISSPAQYDTLKYNGTHWVNEAPYPLLTWTSTQTSTGVFTITHTEITPATTLPTIIATPRYLSGAPASGATATVERTSSTTFVVRLNDNSTGALTNAQGFRFIVYSRGRLQFHGEVGGAGAPLVEG